MDIHKLLKEVDDALSESDPTIQYANNLGRFHRALVEEHLLTEDQAFELTRDLNIYMLKGNL